MPDPEVLGPPARYRFNAEYKLRIVEEANAATEPEQVGTLLRREGAVQQSPCRLASPDRADALSSLARQRGRPRQEPVVAELEIHVVLDNLNTHKPKHDRWLTRHKNIHLHFTPTHASWLNQVEVWISILSRRALVGPATPRGARSEPPSTDSSACTRRQHTTYRATWFPESVASKEAFSHAPSVVARGGTYEQPIERMAAYLDAMAVAYVGPVPDELVPVVVAALGPQMIELAAARTDGAHSYFVPVEHTTIVRERLGDGALLAVLRVRRHLTGYDPRSDARSDEPSCQAARSTPNGARYFGRPIVRECRNQSGRISGDRRLPQRARCLIEHGKDRSLKPARSRPFTPRVNGALTHSKRRRRLEAQ